MFTVKLTAALVVVAAVLPAGAVAMPDLRSPDAADAGRVALAPQDLRSPDARDAAAGLDGDNAHSSGISSTRTAPSVSDGFEWGDAGIGAGVMLALVSLAGGTALLVARARQHTRMT